MTRPTSGYSASIYACIHLYSLVSNPRNWHDTSYLPLLCICMHPFMHASIYTLYHIHPGMTRPTSDIWPRILHRVTLPPRKRPTLTKGSIFFFILRPKQVRRSYSDIHTYMCMHPFMHASIYACIHLCTKAKANAEIIQ
jgi:hypothetical protein